MNQKFVLALTYVSWKTGKGSRHKYGMDINTYFAPQDVYLVL
jgi:hypothetical protein